jgi:hypothetical protein
MLDAYLVPDKTTVTAKGDGPLLDLGALESRVLLLELKISGAVEQESIEVSILGGADEPGIGKLPLASFPQLFYRGDYPLLLDLTAVPQARVLRAHWEVNRWGRGSQAPWFEFGVRATEVSPQLLKEREAGTRRA